MLAPLSTLHHVLDRGVRGCRAGSTLTFVADLQSSLGKRLLSAFVVSIGVVAAAAGFVLAYAPVMSHGSDCGSVVFPEEPPTTDPNYLLAGCLGARLGRVGLVVMCAIVLGACVIVLVKRRGVARSWGEHSSSAGQPSG